jgi:hypothetical protein
MHTCSSTAQLLRSLEENPVDVGLAAVRFAQTFWFLQTREKPLLLSGI